MLCPLASPLSDTPPHVQALLSYRRATLAHTLQLLLKEDLKLGPGERTRRAHPEPVLPALGRCAGGRRLRRRRLWPSSRRLHRIEWLRGSLLTTNSCAISVLHLHWALTRPTSTAFRRCPSPSTFVLCRLGMPTPLARPIHLFCAFRCKVQLSAR